MSHRGRRVQASASWEADCAVPCSWTRSSETRDGWINTMRQTACSHFLPLPRWNENALWAQPYEHKEGTTAADFNRAKGHPAPQNCPSFFSLQRDAWIFPAMEGKPALLLYITHELWDLVPKKSRSELNTKEPDRPGIWNNTNTAMWQ